MATLLRSANAAPLKQLPEPQRARSGAAASTSTAPLTLCRRLSCAAAPPRWSHSAGTPLRDVAAAARRRGGGGREDEAPGGGRSGGPQFSKRGRMYRVQYNQYEYEVLEDEAWKLAVPLLGGLVLSAAIIGPLVIGIVFSAITLGAALSAGAIFTSLFLPFFILIGMGALFFGGLTFSAFASLGAALLLPKLIGLGVAAGGLGLGAMAVSLFLKPAAERAKVSYAEAEEEEEERPKGGRRGGSAQGSGQPQRSREAEELSPEVDPEVERQLREFDELLAASDDKRRSTEGRRRGGR